MFIRSVQLFCLIALCGICCPLTMVAQDHTLKRFDLLKHTTDEQRWVDSVFNTLSPKDRIAQLFMLAAYSNMNDKHVQNIKYAVEKLGVGGLIFFQGTAEKEIELTNQYQKAAKVPLIIGIDGEWGVGMRLDGVINFPRQMTLGAIQDTRLLYELGREMGRQCNLLGIHINFAPSVDVNNNPNNPVINSRSFGENPNAVAAKAWQIAKGMWANKVLGSAKHFPGHGDTDKDSHHELPELKQSRKRLDTVELKPFRELIDSGVAMVMVGHLYVDALESKANTPSSISYSIITDLLKNELGFKGLTISDALNMKGLKNNADGENTTVAALKAGQDILLMPDNAATNIKAIEDAIAENTLSQYAIDASCRKVLTAKYRVGLNKKSNLDSKTVRAKLNSPYAKGLKARLYENAITLVSNQNNLLPLMHLENNKIAYLGIGTNKSKVFGNQLAKYGKVKAFTLSTNPSQSEMDSLQSKLKDYTIVIVGYHATNSQPGKDFGFESKPMNFVYSLANDDRKVIFSFFGSPYVLDKLNQTSTALSSLIIAYDNSEESQKCTAQMIFGGQRFRGKLPVTGGQFKAGSGIDTYVTRLSYIIPEEIGIQSADLRSVDSLAEELIQKKGAPGCQIIAVCKGKVFYEKAFGTHTYLQRSAEVDVDDIYDLASLTKVSGTLPVVMKMVSDNKLNLRKQLKDYIDLPAGSDKRSIVIRDLLTHEAGLVAWLPFHLNYFKTPDNSNVFATKASAIYTIQLPGTQRFLNKDAELDKELFAHTQSILFPNRVAASLFASDNVRRDMYNRIDSSKLQSKQYRYSDLSFIYLQRIIETAYKKDLDKLSQELFFAPLGMDHTGYVPITKFDKKQIPPTENDRVFRKQLVHAYPHDQAAALLGGISGHAGLFSNANDLAKLYQMILNKGSYGGNIYLSDEVVTQFVSQAKKGSRRGLGYDKQEPDSNKKSPIGKEASLSSFGHTGYTGTMVWVDPDRELIYVFLSNRVHPSAENNILSQLGTRGNIFSSLIKAVDNSNK